MLTLAIDTSHRMGSVCLAEGPDQILGKIKWKRGKGYSEPATGHVQELLKEVKVDTKDLQRLAVGLGPGSFTGIRVAINIVRSLGYSFDLPVIGVDSLRIIAEPALKKGLCSHTWVATNAFKNQVYVSGFKDLNCVLGPVALSPQGFETRVLAAQPEEVLLLGDGFEAYRPLFSKEFASLIRRPTMMDDFPSAHSLAMMSFDPAWSNQAMDWKQIKPVYVRVSEAEENLAAGKLPSGLLKPIENITRLN